MGEEQADKAYFDMVAKTSDAMAKQLDHKRADVQAAALADLVSSWLTIQIEDGGSPLVVAKFMHFMLDLLLIKGEKDGESKPPQPPPFVFPQNPNMH